MRGAAAASHRAAAAVKYSALHAARAGDRDDLLLRLVELPRRGDDAAVLARIGIPQHHLLLLARDLQQGRVHRVVEQRAQDLVNAIQIVDGLEQGCNAEVAEPAVLMTACK